MGTSARILLASDHALFRDGLRRLLESEPEFRVIGEAADADEALRHINELTPDMLLLDWMMAGMTADVVLRGAAASVCAVKVIVLTASVEKSEMLRALELGARGLVPKESRYPLLLKAMRGVMAGQYWVGRESLVDLVNALRSLTSPSPVDESRHDYRLTKREYEIVAALADACANKDIAQLFSISERTVKHHLTNIFDKVGVSSRLELALFARNHRLRGDDSPPPSLRDSSPQHDQAKRSSSALRLSSH